MYRRVVDALVPGFVLAFAVVACSGVGNPVPTPINSALGSVDVGAFCSATAPSAQDLQAIATAAAAAAGGAGFSVDNAAARIDSAIAGLRTLSVTGDAAAARDRLAAALEKLKTELPKPSVDTVKAASDAAVAFEAAKGTFCR